MIKTIEHNDGESRLQGAVEFVGRIENGTYVYTVTEYIEDKVFGMPHQQISAENLEAVLSKSEKGVLKELKKMADILRRRTIEGKLSLKGYSDPE